MGQTRRVRKGGFLRFSKLTTSRPPSLSKEGVSANEVEASIRFWEQQAQEENTNGRRQLLSYVERLKKYLKNMKFKQTGEFTQNNPMVKKGGRTKKQRRRRMTRRRR